MCYDSYNTDAKKPMMCKSYGNSICWYCVNKIAKSHSAQCSHCKHRWYSVWTNPGAEVVQNIALRQLLETRLNVR